MGAMGPSSDPIGGQLDLSDEVVKGVPDTLTDLHVRFVDFQWNLILSEAFAKGRIDSSKYNHWRDRTLHADLPQEPMDQHAIGEPTIGEWTVEVTGIAVEGPGSPYLIRGVLVDPDVTLEVRLDKEFYKGGG